MVAFAIKASKCARFRLHCFFFFFLLHFFSKLLFPFEIVNSRITITVNHVHFHYIRSSASCFYL